MTRSNKKYANLGDVVFMTLLPTYKQSPEELLMTLQMVQMLVAYSIKNHVHISFHVANRSINHHSKLDYLEYNLGCVSRKDCSMGINVRN